MPNTQNKKFSFLKSKGKLGDIIYNKDWSKTSMGKIEEWPLNFQFALSICLNSVFPIGVFWGKNLVFFYNDAYVPILGEKHPWSVGRTAAEAWPEVWNYLYKRFEDVFDKGMSIRLEDTLLILQRHGYNEECYFDYSLSPIWNPNGTVDGVFNAVVETTYKVINERRNLLLHDLAKHSNDSKNIKEECKELSALLAKYPMDVSFHILYLRDEDTMEFKPQSYAGFKNKEYLETDWPFDHVMKYGEAQLEFLGNYISDIKDPVWKENCVEASILPIGNPSDPEGMLVVGLSPRKRFNVDYQNFLDSIEVHISTSLLNARSFERKAQTQRIIEENEQRLKIAVESTHIGTWDYNPITDILICSERTRVIFGLPQEGRMRLKNIFDEISIFDEDRIKAAVENALNPESSGVFDVEYSLKHTTTSQPKWVKAKGQVFFTSEGVPYRFIGTALDISVQKNAEKELMFSLERFKLLADSMSQHIWVSNSDGEIDYVNKAVYEHFGPEPEKVMKNAGLAVVHPEDKEKHIEYWKKSVENAQEFLIEHRMLRKDNEYRWMQTRAIPQKTSDGRIKIWVGTSTDIQEHKHFTERLENKVEERTHELKLANIELEKMNQELASFAYVSSHDLQEPLRKIRTFVERIVLKENENLSDTGKDYLDRMQKAAERMQKLIVDLLSYSRTNTTKKVYEKYNLNELINEVLADLDQRIIEKNAKIKVGELPELKIIPFQMKQLFTNLISNAMKFTRDGETCEIDISANDVLGKNIEIEGVDPKQKFCKIVVADNGIGFEQQFATKIFEVFQRLHGRDKYSGTGIGLAICKRIVENHLGYITASGEKGKGARFNVYIPYKI